MKLQEGTLRWSASDLANFAACRHLTLLDLAAAHGLASRPRPHSLSLEALAERGLEHESAVLQGFRERGWSVTAVEGADDVAAARATEEAMGAEVDVIYQGVLLVDDRLGRPDFLVRAGRLGGETGYEVVDAKLARTAKALAVLQTTFYSRLLSVTTGIEPQRMHLALGNGALVPFRVASFAAYERQAGTMFRELIAREPAFPPAGSYPDPTEHCAQCAWSRLCDGRRRADDDLSLVAGMTARQRVALQAADVPSRRALAAADGARDIGGVGADALERIRAQARLQVRGEDEGRHLWELIEPERDAAGELVAGRGLLALPEPAEGDLFFDIEGARHYSEDGREFGLQYLFGIVDTADIDEHGRPRYHAFWAMSRAEEKRAFEDVIDLIVARLTAHPGAHVYHYNHYEPTSLDHLSELHLTRKEVIGRLMGRFATRESEVDDLLRREAFVDLYRVVRQGVRASVESYSIKKLEPLCGFVREVALGDANPEMIRFEVDLDRGDASAGSATAEIVRGYNEDDCRATLALRDWLEERRGDLASHLGAELPRPVPPEPPESEDDSEVAQLRLALLEGVPEEEAGRSDEQRARVLLADLLEYHRREEKPMWWRYFHLKELSAPELVGEPDAIGGLRFVGTGEHVKRSTVHLYEFPPQEHGFEPGKTVEDPVTGNGYTVHSLEDTSTRIGLLRADSRADEPHPAALIAKPGVTRTEHAAAIREIARAVIENASGSWPCDATTDLLLRRRPRTGVSAQGPLVARGDGSPVEQAVSLAGELRTSYLPMQGPPGTGKTYTGAHQILALVREGRKVGVTAMSHAVIRNVLNAVALQARSCGVEVRLGQKPDADRRWLSPEARHLKSNAELVAMLADGTVQVAGATTWAWVAPGSRAALDVLIVDEAGQLCVADTLASSRSAASVVLLGDPMQLNQVSQGAHPPGSDVSALAHVLDGSATMPAERGIFMAETRRMHPSITRFISDAFYDGRLHGIDGLEHQRILGGGPLSGSGIRLVDVTHRGNANSSVEEANAVTGVVAELLGRRWRNPDGDEQAVGPDDVLVVTPFNAQIRAIERSLEAAGLDGVAVGTVDRFQGREAAAVVYSMASSTAEDAPRGMEFLFDLHRLNVAISRARCLAVVVSSPELCRASCHTPRQMELVNALCMLRESALPGDGTT